MHPVWKGSDSDPGHTFVVVTGRGFDRHIEATFADRELAEAYIYQVGHGDQRRIVELPDQFTPEEFDRLIDDVRQDSVDDQ